jgi:hypothetical protein
MKISAKINFGACFSILIISASTSAFATDCKQLRNDVASAKAAGKILNDQSFSERDQKCLGRGQLCKVLRVEVTNLKIAGEVVENYLQLDEADLGCLQGET